MISAKLAAERTANAKEENRLRDIRQAKAEESRRKKKVESDREKAAPLVPEYMKEMQVLTEEAIRAGQHEGHLCIDYPPDCLMDLLYEALTKHGYRVQTNCYSDNEGPDINSITWGWA